MSGQRQCSRIPRSLALAFLAAIVSVAFSGCQKQPQTTQPTTQAKPVSLRLQWFHTAQFAGFYLAKDNGFYEQQHLKVTLNPGGPDFNAITLVANGSDTFGVWTADQVLAASARGVPIKIVAAIYRKDPNVLMVKKGSGIKSPTDFKGKTVTTVFGRATESVLRAMLQKAGVEEAAVKIVPFPFSLQSFAEGKVDVSAAYVYDHPFQARKLGIEVELIDPADYGINFYSDCVFARTDLIEKDPGLVESFVHATLRGWEEALGNKEKALAAVMANTTGLDRESQMYMLEHSEPLIRHENPKQLGLVSEKSLQQMYTVLRAQKVIDKDIRVGDAYTNRFVESYYRKQSGKAVSE